jgi:hypothetical protein
MGGLWRGFGVVARRQCDRARACQIHTKPIVSTLVAPRPALWQGRGARDNLLEVQSDE